MKGPTVYDSTEPSTVRAFAALGGSSKVQHVEVLCLWKEWTTSMIEPYSPLLTALFRLNFRKPTTLCSKREPFIAISTLPF